MQSPNPELFFDLKDFPHAALFEGCVYVWEALSKIESYLRSLPLGKIETSIPQGVFLIRPESISIGEGTTIEPGAFIQGPCVIGKNCSIRHGAYLRGNVIAGDRSVLGHVSEFKNAILFDEAHAAHFAYVGDSILGRKVNLGAGTVCANLRFDKQPIRVRWEGEKIETHLRKFGAVVGDGSQTACHTVMNPGTLVARKTIVDRNI